MSRTCYAAAFLLVATLFFSCKKNDLITGSDASVYFSTDTLKFDTVFTTVGSVTKSFKIFNNNDGRLKLDQVKLMGSNASSFTTNIDGIATPELRDIEIAANDSIYVFVTVTIDPNAAQIPFIVSDSILVEYNGNNRFVQLEAYGKNARFLRGETLLANTTFNNDLPYVILGGLRVDTNVTLTINPGTELYFHANAPLVVDGSLVAIGSVSQPILFTGDRLDEYYRDLPGSWPGIYLRQASTNHHLKFCHIINAYQGISSVGPSLTLSPKLKLEQSQVRNIYDAGLFFLSSSAEVSNTLIANCGSNLQIRQGGEYAFTHCTMASYPGFNFFRNTPVVSIYNYDEVNGQRATADLTATLTNCIIWGEGSIMENEIETGKDDNANFTLTLDHCLHKSPDAPLHTIFLSPIPNLDPQFDSIDVYNNYYDFHIGSEFAPGLDAGTLTPFAKDLDDRERNVGVPDVGAYEKQ